MPLTPIVQLIAHEAWHTVQQAGGTQLQCKLEVSSPGDHLEQEADRAADVMVAAAMTGSAAKANVSSGGGGAVQRKAVDTDYGRFETSTFKQKNAGDGVTPIGVDIVLDFVPGPKVDATSIGLVQSVLVQIFGETAVVDPTKDKKQVKTGLGAGSTIDKVPEEVDPIYPSENAKSTGGLGSGKPNAGELGEYGWHYRDAGSLRTKNARLIDQPVHPTWKSTDAIPKVDKDGNKRKVLPFGSQEFETAALVLEGTQKGSYLGSVEWGFDLSVVGGALVFTGKDIELRAGSMPSAGFMAAAKEWNASTALGTVKTRAGAGLYDHDLATRLKTMVAGTTVKLIKRMVRNGVVWYGVELSKTESGMMMLKELEDMGDGEATIDLPIQSWGRVKTSAALMSGPGSGDKLVDLPVEQLVKVMEQGKTWLHVETDASSLKKAPTAKPDVAGMVRGYVERAKLIV